MSKRRSRKWYSAQSMLEFALIGPMFFVALLGTVELGRMMWINHEVSAGTREGARWAAVRGERSGITVTDAGVKDVVLDRTTGLTDGALTVTVNYEPNNSPGSSVRVNTTYVYTPMLGGFLGIGNITMERQSIMTVHY